MLVPLISEMKTASLLPPQIVYRAFEVLGSSWSLSGLQPSPGIQLEDLILLLLFFSNELAEILGNFRFRESKVTERTADQVEEIKGRFCEERENIKSFPPLTRNTSRFSDSGFFLSYQCHTCPEKESRFFLAEP